ncbi:extracellular catalytic domain type 1 short-chain-length polyhydroxyalkanoate depolymerase [Thermococcus sp.]
MKRSKYILLSAVLFLLLLVSFAHRKPALYPGDIRGSIVVEGRERTFILHLPANFSREKSFPLVIALHGGGGNGYDMERLTKGGLNRLADEEGFIAVYPDAVRKHWNDGRNLSGYYSQRENIDDVAFISALIDYLVENYNANAGRVYVAGMSNGGLMAYRLACEVPEKLRAIAVVGVPMSEMLYEECSSTVPLPIMIILGTDDPLVPWNGGELHFGPVKLGRVVSIEKTVGYWAVRNGCTVMHGREYLPDADPEDGTRVWVERYSNCTDEAEVVLYGIEGGGHTWPGGYQYLPERIIGKTSRDIDANKIIWRFFEDHGYP